MTNLQSDAISLFNQVAITGGSRSHVGLGNDNADIWGQNTDQDMKRPYALYVGPGNLRADPSSQGGLMVGTRSGESGMISLGGGLSSLTGDGNGALTLSVGPYVSGRDISVNANDGHILFQSDIASTQVQAATGPVGTITGKLEIFDDAGNSLGFLPIYDSIT